jgi:hypothetical protein
MLTFTHIFLLLVTAVRETARVIRPCERLSDRHRGDQTQNTGKGLPVFDLFARNSDF